MKLVARSIDVPADPLRIARSVADEPGFVFLWNATGAGPSYVACDPLAASGALDPEPALGLDPHAGPLAEFPKWIGLLPYESRRVLERPAWTRSLEDRPSPHVTEPSWARFGAVARIATDVLVAGDDADSVARLVSKIRAGSAARRDVRAEALAVELESTHAARIRGALELILDGQIYQVNLARRFDFRLQGRAVDIVERLAARARAPYAIACEWDGLSVAGASPELFLRLDAHGRLVTVPIKGTRPRGHDAPSDRAIELELDRDPKERAELAMVVDVERNDLGRIARTGSVRVRGAPRVTTFGTVHHRVATVTARLRPNVGRAELLEAMLPSGSVTGAPKIRAMEVIATLESARRGLYTGAFGALGHDGSLHLAMAIRTLTRREGIGHYFSGGGIVADSDVAREVAETGWKAVQLERGLGG